MQLKGIPVEGGGGKKSGLQYLRKIFGFAGYPQELSGRE